MADQKPAAPYKAGAISENEAQLLRKCFDKIVAKGKTPEQALVATAKTANRRVTVIQNSAKCPWAHNITLTPPAPPKGKAPAPTKASAPAPTKASAPAPFKGQTAPKAPLAKGSPKANETVKGAVQALQQEVAIAPVVPGIPMSPAQINHLEGQFGQFGLVFQPLFNLSQAFEAFHKEMEKVKDPSARNITLAAADQLVGSFSRGAGLTGVRASLVPAVVPPSLVPGPQDAVNPPATPANVFDPHSFNTGPAASLPSYPVEASQLPATVPGIPGTPGV